MVPAPLLTVLAHQGGWDEILLVAGPLAVLAVLLVVANRRVQGQVREPTSAPVERDGE